MQDDDDDLVGAMPPKGRKPKETASKNSVAAADELRQLIERFEALEADKQAIASDQKDLMNEAKGRGYDTKAMRKIIAERKANADDLANFNAIVELYREVLGMG